MVCTCLYQPITSNDFRDGWWFILGFTTWSFPRFLRSGETWRNSSAACAQAQLPPNVVMMEAVSAEEASKGEMKRLLGARTACWVVKIPVRPLAVTSSARLGPWHTDEACHKKYMSNVIMCCVFCWGLESNMFLNQPGPWLTNLVDK